MRKLLLPLVLASCNATFAQLQNGGFEELNSSQMPAYWQGDLVLLPVWVDDNGVWHTDSVVYDGGANYVVNATDVHSGAHAAELRNGFDFTTGTPIRGTWSATPESDQYLGFPQVAITSQQPTGVDFFAKFIPAAGDSAVVNSVVYDELGEVIGGGELVITATVATYTAFHLPITYVSAGTAASFSLTFATARAGGQVTFGTRLLIDDVTLDLQQGIAEAAAGPVLDLYPNPATSGFRVDAGGTITALQVLDMTGRTCAVEWEPGGTVSCEGLSAGTYVLQARTAAGVSRSRFVVR